MRMPSLHAAPRARRQCGGPAPRARLCPARVAPAVRGQGGRTAAALARHAGAHVCDHLRQMVGR
eukprot:2768504-Prymnesium_polylepis.1